MTSAPRNPFALSYSDNVAGTVGERLGSFVEKDPSLLWVTSGYFALGIWAVLGDALGRVGDFRLLLGRDPELEQATADVDERRIQALVQVALRRQGELPGLPSRDQAEDIARLADFLERQHADGKPVVKLWDDERFLHAKAFVMPHCVGIGSANFTVNGLSWNRELVGWRQDEGVIAQLREWFEGLWSDPHAADHTDELITALRATPLVADSYRPYDVLIRALAARYGTDRPPSLEAATFSLYWFQEDAVFRLIRLLGGPARGALLADAVGLGKTYMALGVVHHFLYRHAESRRGTGPPVLLLAPKSLVGMWEAELRKKGLDWACEVVALQALRSDFDEARFSGADLIVIDEAHRLRGGGTWFKKAVDLVSTGDRPEDKRVLLLTATPVHTGMNDLVNLLRVMTKNRRNAWAPDIADFERYLNRVERDGIDPFPILDRALVRRSRGDLLRAQDEAHAAGVNVDAITLPERRLAHIDYQYGGDHDLFGLFERTLRSLALAPYDLSRFTRIAAATGEEPLPLFGPDGEVIDGGGEGLGFAPGSLAGLMAMGLLVRFQSSISALRRSLSRLDAVLARTAQALTQDPPRLLDLQKSTEIRTLLSMEAEIGDRDHDDPDLDGDAGSMDPLTARWDAALEGAPQLADADAHDLGRIHAAIAADRLLIAALLEAVPSEADDLKFAALVAALTRKGRGGPGRPALANRQVLIFTQFRDTARYLHRRLQDADVRGFVGEALLVDGGVPQERRAERTDWFSPETRAKKETEARARGEAIPHLMVTTDVLAEGHNLQAADCVVNYDLHFNPQVVVQRSGRVDRLGSPHERILLASFLPPEPLERHIGLLGRLDGRFRRIHGLGLGDEKVMPLAGDTPGQTLEQLRRIYRDDDVGVLDEIERSWAFGSTDYMRQPLEAFLQSAGRERLNEIPVGVTSVRRAPPDAPLGPGVFIALAAPPDRSGTRESFWRYYPATDEGFGPAATDETAIFRMIACRPPEPRAPLPNPPAGPSVIDWDLLRRAAEELAGQLTLNRSTAAAAAGGSERSRTLRLELRAGLDGLGIDGAPDLLERLLQVDVGQYDGRSGWSRFNDARRRLRRAETEGARRDAGLAVVDAGMTLLGAPTAQDDSALLAAEVRAVDLQLVAYEVVVPNQPGRAPEMQMELGGTDGRLFDGPGDQLSIR